MNNIVSFELAKMARDCGFNESDVDNYYNYWNATNSYLNVSWPDPHEYYDVNIRIQAPTLSELQRWLREKHSINVEVNIQDGYYTYYNYLVYNRLDIYTKSNKLNSENNLYENYEEALEAGLIEALKIIKL